MAGLGVNIDHVATVRQARRTIEPDPVWAAAAAELGGADGITIHLRQDRRHIGDRDVELLKQVVKVKLNLEMSLADEIVRIALKTRPGQATLVPENRQEVTTEGGLDVVSQAVRVAEVTAALQDEGIEVSAFVDPEPDQIAAAAEAGCDAIEIHTGRYANAATGAETAAAVDAILDGLNAGRKAGLVVHGGHGLTYTNIERIAGIAGFSEFNIGHSIISRAIFVGLTEAVREMKRLIDRAEARTQRGQKA
ncbi:MAG: pyridoxine 5'-phosphate synthase [Planctomycetes bacterium]|nr:pyridoxine 5'-phosphate synthase [Planctomycetota bacterium]